MKISLKLARKNREISPDSWESLYKSEIVRRIRERYSSDDELAIMRQKDTKPQEYASYNEYVESCKAAAKAELGMEVQNEDIPS